MSAIDIFLGLMERNKKTLQLMLGILVMLVILATETKAQADGFIYGTVYTSSNSYTGQIRWGKGEAYWNDHCNASKISSKSYSTPKPKEKKESWFDGDWSISSIWDNKRSSTVHQFGCQFGDIKEIKPLGGSRAIIKFKNDEAIEVSGDGYEDIGAKINVLDEDLGLVEVRWDRIERVEFLSTPKRLTTNFGKSLYGTVQTSRKGSFTGYIQWDHDERLSTDKLDGGERGTKYSIPFGSIVSISKDGAGSEVELKSGKRVYLTGTNDVNNGNRGIIVSVDGVGKIDIPWRIFERVDLKQVSNSGSSYDSYKKPKGLYGTVYLYNDKKISGQIVYDLDESWEFEFVEARDDEIEYILPMRNIKRIKPKNYEYAAIVLRNGDELFLGKGRDITDSNDGLMVFTKSRDKPEYVSWSKISEIVFD